MAYASKKRLADNSIVPLGSNLYGTCSTASNTAEKAVTMPDFNVLVEGVTIHVYFTNKNTASNPTLKVGSTEARPIRYNGQASGSWEDGGFISFTYYNGSWFQNDITIGGVTYTFSISGHTMTISGSDGSTQTITLPNDTLLYTKDAANGTTTNNVLQNAVEGNIANGGYALAEGYYTEASGAYSHAEGYGTTASGEASHAEGAGTTASGAYSHAEGYGTTASDLYSHAEGYGTTASDLYSHAEGCNTTASDLASHAEGYYTKATKAHSHAEGYTTTASGLYSHAEGDRTIASGTRSHAQNFRTIASSDNQTALGKYNIEDANDKYAVIVGNGTADDKRSNGLTVAWDGNVEMALDTTATSGTDKEIYDALVDLGWDSDVIV